MEVDPTAHAPAYAVVFSVQVAFTAYQLMTHMGLSGYSYDPVVFGLLRAVGTAMVLFLWALAFEHRFPGDRLSWLPRAGDRWRFVLLGFFMTCNVMGLVFALKSSSSSLVAILQVLRPVFAGLISWGLGFERFKMMKLVGIAVCLCGTFVIVLGRPDSWGWGQDVTSPTKPPISAKEIPLASPIVGFIWVCVHSVGQSAYVILQPSLLDAGYTPAVVNYYAFMITSCFIAALLPFQSLHSGVWWENSWFFIGTTLFSIFFVGAYAYAVMGWAAKRIGGTAVMVFMLLQAILTVLGGHFILDEQIHPDQIFGGVILMLGIVIFVSTPPGMDNAKLWWAAAKRHVQSPLLSANVRTPLIRARSESPARQAHQAATAA